MASEVVRLWSQHEASGRDAELSLLLREYDEARSSERARFVFVRGPAGVGKSHLFRTLRQALAARGVAVFEAESPRETHRPFGLFVHLLDALVQHLNGLAVAPERLSRVSRCLELLRGAGMVGDRRLEIYDAACEVVVLAGQSCPVFLLPDLDAADRASLELFRYLSAVATAPESRAAGLFVASFRDDAELPRPLSEVVSKTTSRSLALGGLDVEGIRAYLSRTDVAQRLLEATGGNPDALVQLLERPARPPAELFLRRAAKLGQRAQAVLTVLSVAREPLPLEIIAGTLARLGRGDEGLAGTLDQLVRAHVVIVRVVSGRPVYRFNRDGEKEAWLESLARPEVVETQRALGEELAASGELAAASALLFEVDPKGRGAALSLAAAEELAARGAHEDAADLFQRALPHLGAEDRERALRRLCDIATAQGDFRQALRHLLKARRAVARTQDAEPAAADSLRAAGLLIRLGRLGLAERALARPRQSPTLWPEAMAALVEIQVLHGRTDQAIALGEEVLPKLASAPEQAIALRNTIGKAHLVRGALSAADACFQANHEEALTHGLDALAIRAMLNRGVVAQRMGDRERAIRCYQNALGSEGWAKAQALANLGSIYAETGDFELALDHLSRGLQVFTRFGRSREVAMNASNLARLNLFLGDLDRATELSEYSLRLAREIGETYLQASALTNLAAALIDRRDLHQAHPLLDEARRGFEEVGNEGFAALACALKARAHLMLGERAQASAELSKRIVERGASQLPAAAIELGLVQAELSLALGDLHQAGRAVARAREALLGAPELEAPYRIYFVMGKIRQAAGDVSGAQAEIARAARLLDELTQRVPAPRRMQFLSLPRRSEVLAAADTELRLPRQAQLSPVKDPATTHGLVGQSSVLRKLTRQLEPIARSSATVLIRGESGTGKELLADAIHRLSPRREMTFVKVNCAAMVEELLLSELFGHEKGAFTGAIRERKGRFELADGGTIFLDEIGDISPKCQVALLRVLQEREFERVGGTKTLRVDVRVICATNRDLEALIAQGRFRQDLYYRLKGVMLELPPLRDRAEDLPALATHFLTRIARERKEPVKQLSEEALQLLARHTWPGNVRELENVLASAAIFAEGTVITPEAFAHVSELAALMDGEDDLADEDADDEVEEPSFPRAEGKAPSDGVDYYRLIRGRGLSLKDLRHEVETECIRRALLEAGGNISEAARLLKMKRSRLSQIVNAEPTLKEVAHGTL